MIIRNQRFPDDSSQQSANLNEKVLFIEQEQSKRAQKVKGVKMAGGYMEKLLFVNLATGEIKGETLDESLYRKFYRNLIFPAIAGTPTATRYKMVATPGRHTAGFSPTQFLGHVLSAPIFMYCNADDQLLVRIYQIKSRRESIQ